MIPITANNDLAVVLDDASISNRDNESLARRYIPACFYTHARDSRAFQGRCNGGAGRRLIHDLQIASGHLRSSSDCNANSVFDLRDAWCSPSRHLGLLAFSPGTDGAAKDDLATLSLH